MRGQLDDHPSTTPWNGEISSTSHGYGRSGAGAGTGARRVVLSGRRPAAGPVPAVGSAACGERARDPSSPSARSGQLTFAEWAAAARRFACGGECGALGREAEGWSGQSRALAARMLGEAVSRRFGVAHARLRRGLEATGADPTRLAWALLAYRSELRAILGATESPALHAEDAAALRTTVSRPVSEVLQAVPEQARGIEGPRARRIVRQLIRDWPPPPP